MTYAVETRHAIAGGTTLKRLMAHISDRLARRRVYRRTHVELSGLSTRELDDLGISRSMITRLAYEAAYRK